MANEPKTVVVLGGGIGGVAVARALRRQLPRPHRIVLVDRERTHLFAPSLLWLMVGQRDKRSIQRPLERLARKGINVRFGEVQRIEPDTRRVTVSGETFDADYLVIALGAELHPEAIPGLAQAGHNFYTLPGAEAFLSSLRSSGSGRIIVLTASPAYKCPAAPYEAAMLVEAFCRKRSIRDAVQIDVYAAEPVPMGVAGPEVSTAVKQLLAARNIPYHPDHQVTSVDTAAKLLMFANGTCAEFDLLAYVPPHRPPRVIADSGLVDQTGWIAVDRHTLETRVSGVYAIGDVVSIPLTLGKPLLIAARFLFRTRDGAFMRVEHATPVKVKLSPRATGLTAA
jgi:sulfide:quinone oxidoreductase